MNEYYETLLEQLQETVIQLIENSDNIFTAQNNIEEIVRDMFSSYIDDNYITIKFDSPLGYDSKIALLNKVPNVEWVGELGHRGDTYVRLDREKFEHKSERAIKEYLNSLYNEDILLDKYSKIVINK